MSHSPPIRRLSTASANSRQEDLINAYEAEEERIINLLSRKLEQLREQKIDMENAHEAESEFHVNRLSRELNALRQSQNNGFTNGNGAVDHNGSHIHPLAAPSDLLEPSAESMLEAMRKENEQLRNRLADTERDYIRISRLNEVYREELIEHRRRLGISVDHLIGMVSSDPYSQPIHQRSSSISHSSASSPSTSVQYLPSYGPRPTHGVPIPRPPSQIHRPINIISEGNTPLSHSPASSDSPFPFSPVTSTNPASHLSTNTNITSPPSSFSFSNAALTYQTPSRGLSYPSVPPPSLSSSFGSPSVSYHMPHRDPSLSPTEPLSRRNSIARRGSIERRVAETGSLRNMSRNADSRRNSMDRGARVAETGVLIPRTRSRAGSQSLPPMTEAPDSPDLGGISIAIGKLDGFDSESSPTERS